MSAVTAERSPFFFTPVTVFCDALIRAAAAPGDGLQWWPFMARDSVVQELAGRGYELIEDGSVRDPRLRRFFAVRKVRP